jgi:hypothetical protein
MGLESGNMGFGFGEGQFVKLQDRDDRGEGASQGDDLLVEQVSEVREHVGAVALTEGDGDARACD